MRETRVLCALAALVAGVTTTIGMGTASPASATATTTTTTLVSSVNPATVGQAVTLTATVAGSAPSGEVVFSEPGATLGSAVLDAGGVATLVVSFPSVGDHELTAFYPGDDNNVYSGGTLMQKVVAPPSVPVTPPPPPPAPPVVKRPSVTLVASTQQAEVGDEVVLRWHTKNADTVRASGDWGGKQKVKGSASVRMTERGKHVFKLTVKNAAGKKTAKVTVMAARKAKELELVVTEELTEIGTEVDVTADGLAKGEDYTLRLNGKVILTGLADKKGDVARTFTVPKGTPPGEVPLTITGSNPSRVGATVLNVIGPTKLEVTVAAAELDKGAQQTITVAGLLPGEAYTLTLDGKKLTSGKADDAGLVSYEFAVGKPFGQQTITVTGALDSRVGKVSYTVRRPVKGPDIRVAAPAPLGW